MTNGDMETTGAKEITNSPPDPRKDSRGGFTLIEILLVVVIIGILAAIVAPKLVGRSKDAREQAARADLRTISNAMDTFEIDNGFFPTSEQGILALIEKPTHETELKKWNKLLKAIEEPKDPWGNKYVYKFPGDKNPDGYDLYSKGPDGQEGTDDDVDLLSSGSDDN